jgi:chemotaxis protein histidine kinase CheA
MTMSAVVKNFIDEARRILSAWEHRILTLENHPDVDSLEQLLAIIQDFDGCCKRANLSHPSPLNQAMIDGLRFIMGHSEYAKPSFLAIYLDCQTLVADWIARFEQDHNAPLSSHKLLDRLNALQTPVSDENPIHSETVVTTSNDTSTDPRENEPLDLQKPSATTSDQDVTPDFSITEEIHTETHISARTPSVIASSEHPVESPVAKTCMTPTTDPEPERTFSIKPSRLDYLERLIEDLCLHHTEIARADLSDDRDRSALIQALQKNAKTLRNLQQELYTIQSCETTLMLSEISTTLLDIARSQEKSVHLTTEAKCPIIDGFALRNANTMLYSVIQQIVSEQIETPEERMLTNKLKSTSLQLSLDQDQLFIYVHITHDGRATSLEAFNRKIVNLESAGPGETACVIAIPRKSFVLDALIVGILGKTYALPLAEISEVINIAVQPDKNYPYQGHKINVRNQEITLTTVPGVSSQIETDPVQINQTLAVVAPVGNTKVAFAVDELIGRHTVVIQPFNRSQDRSQGSVGETILHNGQTATIIQPAKLYKLHQLKAS